METGITRRLGMTRDGDCECVMKGRIKKGSRKGKGSKTEKQKNVGSIGGAGQWASGHLMNIPKAYKGMCVYVDVDVDVCVYVYVNVILYVALWYGLYATVVC